MLVSVASSFLWLLLFVPKLVRAEIIKIPSIALTAGVPKLYSARVNAPGQIDLSNLTIRGSKGWFDGEENTVVEIVVFQQPVECGKNVTCALHRAGLGPLLSLCCNHGKLCINDEVFKGSHLVFDVQLNQTIHLDNITTSVIPVNESGSYLIVIINCASFGEIITFIEGSVGFQSWFGYLRPSYFGSLINAILLLLGYAVLVTWWTYRCWQTGVINFNSPIHVWILVLAVLGFTATLVDVVHYVRWDSVGKTTLSGYDPFSLGFLQDSLMIAMILSLAHGWKIVRTTLRWRTWFCITILGLCMAALGCTITVLSTKLFFWFPNAGHEKYFEPDHFEHMEQLLAIDNILRFLWFVLRVVWVIWLACVIPRTISVVDAEAGKMRLRSLRRVVVVMCIMQLVAFLGKQTLINSGSLYVETIVFGLLRGLLRDDATIVMLSTTAWLWRPQNDCHQSPMEIPAVELAQIDHSID